MGFERETRAQLAFKREVLGELAESSLRSEVLRKHRLRTFRIEVLKTLRLNAIPIAQLALLVGIGAGIAYGIYEKVKPAPPMIELVEENTLRHKGFNPKQISEGIAYGMKACNVYDMEIKQDRIMTTTTFICSRGTIKERMLWHDPYKVSDVGKTVK